VKEYYQNPVEMQVRVFHLVGTLKHNSFQVKTKSDTAVFLI